MGLLAALESLESFLRANKSLHTTQAVLKALKEREVALLTVHSLQRDMVVKQRARQSLMEDGQKVFGGDKGKERKVQGLQNDMATLEQSTSAAEQEYDKVMDRNHQVCRPPILLLCSLHLASCQMLGIAHSLKNGQPSVSLTKQDRTMDETVIGSLALQSTQCRDGGGKYSGWGGGGGGGGFRQPGASRCPAGNVIPFGACRIQCTEYCIQVLAVF